MSGESLIPKTTFGESHYYDSCFKSFKNPTVFYECPEGFNIYGHLVNGFLNGYPVYRVLARDLLKNGFKKDVPVFQLATNLTNVQRTSCWVITNSRPLLFGGCEEDVDCETESLPIINPVTGEEGYTGPIQKGGFAQISQPTALDSMYRFVPIAQVIAMQPAMVAAKKAALEAKNASEAKRAADLKALGDFFEADSKLEEEKAKLARAKQEEEDKKPPVIKNHPLINPKPDDAVKALLDQFDMSNIFL